MKHLLLLVPALVVATSVNAFAEFKQIDLSIYGMDWAICAHAVSVALQKIDGVDSVKVTLNDGRAIVTFKPLNKVTLAQIRAVIEKNGFTPKVATISATADVVADEGGQPQLRVSGTNETFPVSSGTGEAARTDLKKQVGKRVLIQGVVPPLSANHGGAMDVKEVKAVVP